MIRLPPQIYQASDMADLVLHNPLLKSRIAHYPPFLTLGQRPEFQALANDETLLEMIDRQASLATLSNIRRSKPLSPMRI